MKRVTNEDLREDLDGVGDEAIVDTPEVDIPDEQLPAAATDVVDDMEGEYRTIDDVETGIEAAEDGQSHISELKSVVEENGESGKSLSESEETSVNVALESIHESLGMKWVQPTMESVTYRKRREAIIATMEAAQGSLADKIIKGVKATVSAIMDFIMNLIRNNWVLKKYIQAMEKRVSLLKGDAPSKTTMPESAAAMTVKGQADIESAKALYMSSDIQMKMVDIAINMVDQINFRGGVVSKVIPHEILPVHMLPDQYADGRKGNGFLVNNRMYATHQSSAQFTGIDSAFAGIMSAGPSANEAEVLSGSEMKQVLKWAGDIVTSIGTIEAKKNRLKNFVSRVIQLFAEVTTAQASMVSKSADAVSSNFTAIRMFRRILNSVIGKMPLECYKTAKGLIDYVRHSLKYYKSAEA